MLRTTFAVVFASRSGAMWWVYRGAITMTVGGRRRLLGWCGGTGRGRFTNRPYGLYGRAERRVCVCVNRMWGGERPAHPRHTANNIVGAVREPPTTRAVACRRERRNQSRAQWLERSRDGVQHDSDYRQEQ